MFVKLLAAVTLILSSAMAQPLPAEVVERDKPYGGHPRQLIDINARPLSTPKPAIVIVHGGSWQAGDKRTAIAKTKYFLSKGFAVAAMNYRLHPEVTPREQAQDVADAAVWLAKNASAYGIDPRQIYLVGHAAGGHLVSLVGTDPAYLGKHSATPADLGGIVTLDAAVYDVSGAIAANDVQTPQGRLLRQVFTEKSGFWSQVSPIARIAGGQRIPPFLLSYSAGKQSYQTQERPFAAALRRQGGIAILYEALGRNEESIYRFFGQPDDPTTEAVLNFIRREADIPVERKKKGEKEELPEVPWLFTFEAPETDERGRRLTGTQIGNIIAHENRLFAGNAHPNETKESRRGQVLRLDAREERWKLDLQLPRGYTRVASLDTARFSNDSEGRPIETLNYLLAGASYENERGKPAMGGLFIRTPSGEWTKQTLGMIEKDAAGAEVSAIGSWRDKSLGKDLVFAGASPAPLGIYRGVYDAAASGGIKFDLEPEYLPRGQEQIIDFAKCGSRFYAATSRQILMREDGEQPEWESILDLEDVVSVRPYLEDLDIYWQKNYQISSFRCDPGQAKPTLAFTTLNRAFTFDPNDKDAKTEVNIASLIRTRLGREPHYVITGEASLIRSRGRDLEEWIGLEIYYDPDYVAARPPFPHWRTGFGKDGWYLVRTVIGGQISYRLEEIIVPGHDPNLQPLAKITDFERSPFENDNAVYVGGFAPRFEDVTNTAWIARGEL